MKGAVAKSGRAPAAAAAVSLVAGTFLGAWSVSGGAVAVVLAALCGFRLLLGREARNSFAGILSFWVFFLAAGFASGFYRVAAPALAASDAFSRLPPDRDRADRIEGVITDFWSGSPPRAHGRLRAERLWWEGRWQPFPADVFLFVSGEEP
ncbi:MAG TPA: hypothetical protein VJA66_12220, partial [Thermoanaerobaculia bacterium]